MLRPIGVRRGAAQLDVMNNGRLVATFGWFRIETSLDNVTTYHLTGPYRWWRAIGPRGSGADYGFTFGTSTHGGVCIRFREWLPSRYVRGRRMEALTVTVDEPEALGRALARYGIHGEDERAQ